MRGHLKAGERTFVALLALSLFFQIGIPGAAQSSSTGQQPGDIISSNVDLVLLHATVHDGKGGFVSGLPRQDFTVYENNRPQTIELFQHEDVPVAVGLVVDNSGSMQRKQSDVAVAALAFVRSSNPEDEMFIVHFNENVTFGLPNTKLFSAKPEELDEALMGVPATGKTALYDAIEAALTHLKKATRDKKVLIVISDGGDNASAHTLNQVLQDAGRSDVMIYTIGLFDEDDMDRNPRVLKQIARATGGEAFFPEQTSAIVKICERIAADIRNQYTIGYAPTNGNLDGSYRTIKVVARARGGKLLVRARAGYIASPERNSVSAASQDGSK